MNAAIKMQRIADGPAMCFTTKPTPIKTIIANVELKPTFTKSYTLRHDVRYVNTDSLVGGNPFSDTRLVRSMILYYENFSGAKEIFAVHFNTTKRR